MSNPYETPLSDPGMETQSGLSLGELVRAWENLRLRYNSILLPAGLLVVVLWEFLLDTPIQILSLAGLAFGIGANVCFFAGPLAELYLRALFHRGAPAPSLRKTLFVLGLIGSLCLFGVFAIIPLTSR